MDHTAQVGRDGASRRKLGSLLSEILSDAEELVRDHAELARAEVKDSIGKAGKASGLMIGAGALGVFGTLFLLTTIALGINAAADSRWLGFLIVTLLCLAGAGALFVIGRKRLKRVEKPLPKTTEEIKEDVAWVSTTLRSLK